MTTGRLDPARLVTHRFTGIEGVEQAVMLMKDKPSDLIKPLVLLDDAAPASVEV